MKNNKEKILIVDDDFDFLEELSEALSLQGFQVIEVSDPNAALEASERTRPDAILVDLRMPLKSGLQVAVELKNVEEFKDVPIIAMSGIIKDNHEDFLEQCGFCKYYKKPFDPEKVAAEISVLIRSIRVGRYKAS